jgi:hypothetical protein
VILAVTKWWHQERNSFIEKDVHLNRYNVWLQMLAANGKEKGAMLFITKEFANLFPLESLFSK